MASRNVFLHFPRRRLVVRQKVPMSATPRAVLCALTSDSEQLADRLLTIRLRARSTRGARCSPLTSPPSPCPTIQPFVGRFLIRIRLGCATIYGGPTALLSAYGGLSLRTPITWLAFCSCHAERTRTPRLALATTRLARFHRAERHSDRSVLQCLMLPLLNDFTAGPRSALQ